MPEPRLTPLIPPATARPIGSGNAPSPSPALPALRRRLPEAAWSYTIARIDRSGRIAERRLLQTLGWTAGTRLSVTSRDDTAVLVHRDPEGAFAVIGGPRVKAPAGLRSRCEIRTGDPLLLAANSSADVLLIYPVPHPDHWPLTMMRPWLGTGPAGATLRFC
ncbi:hypothetical protein [Amycolatopsis silviterrae]|uniref:Uncharacterized protein n=1 Tax=Amycolatopsis silviterrae TaxID=1656914 RepID=A0ABW5HLV2_9PSEU